MPRQIFLNLLTDSTKKQIIWQRAGQLALELTRWWASALGQNDVVQSSIASNSASKRVQEGDSEVVGNDERLGSGKNPHIACTQRIGKGVSKQ